MAVSAFRSTTRRSCQIGSTDVSVPSTPRSKREPSPARGFHRRSSSMTDFSLSYFSDCSSTSRSYCKRTGGRSSICPSDSESDMDYTSVYHQQQKNVDSVEERPLYLPIVVSNDNQQRNGLRRASSNQNLTKLESNSSDMKHTSVQKSHQHKNADSEDEILSNPQSVVSNANQQCNGSRRFSSNQIRTKPKCNHSDTENISMHQYQHKDVDFEGERHLTSPIVVSRGTRSRGGLRRSSSVQDFVKPESYSRLHTLIPYNDLSGSCTEDFAEEKTIKAVYAQMKSLRTDPPVGDFGNSDFLDAMRSELRRAVADIRMELEESMRQSCSSSGMPDEGRLLESQSTDVIKAVGELRKEYSTKLEQSEKRVQELWSQLTIEERRCLELSKIVKELLPTPSGPHRSSTQTSSKIVKEIP